MPSEQPQRPKKIGVFVLAMINVAAVLGLRNLPSMAVHGWGAVGWYVLGAVCFLLPIGLVGVELSTTWQRDGGLYGWVREAFGESSGFVAIFSEWTSILVWYPAVLAFIASTAAYVVDPSLAADKRFMFVTMMTVFWGSTVVTIFGDRLSNYLGTFGVVVGTVVPALLICSLGVIYVAGGEPLATPPFSVRALLPDLTLGTLPLAGNAILMFAGMEMIGFHANRVRDPKRDLPQAMLVSATIIFILAVLGTMAVAWVVPRSQLSLAAGLMQAFDAFFDVFGLGVLSPVVAGMVAVGGIAGLLAWFGGPARGLHVSVEQGLMPPLFAKVNRHGAPAGVILLQAVIGTVIAVAYLLVPGVDTVYWMLSAMTTLLICAMYVFVFTAFIRLRYDRAEVPRPFRVPGGKPVAWGLGLLGGLSCAATFLISLLPPSDTDLGSPLTYVLIMLGGFLAFMAPPLLLIWRKRHDRPAAPQLATQTPREVAAPGMATEEAAS